jgi:iron complex transport system substrate-binding protein
MVASLVMNSARAYTGLIPSLVLVLVTGTVAAGVEHYVSTSAPPRAAKPGEGYGKSEIRTGREAYPREAVDSDSFIVRVARPARRIVSQYWAIDEYVYSVVPPERVVAVSESAYLDSLSNVAQFVKQYHPTVATDAERVFRLDPDLLMVADSSRVDFCALFREAHIPIHRVFTNFTNLRQIAETTRLTGYLTGEDQPAEAQVAQFWAEIERAKARRPANARAPRVLGFGGNSTYGSETVFDDVVRTLGGINVAAEGGLKGYSNVSGEQIIRWDPEWVIAGADRGKTREVLARLQADPAISLTQAARNGHIVVFEYNIFLPLSPFTRLLVTAMAEALYG